VHSLACKHVGSLDLALENKDVRVRQASHGLKIRSVCCCSDAGLISDHLYLLLFLSADRRIPVQ
jgi:hypothetical protein